MISDLRIEDYDYNLDSGRIAKYPLKERDASKLLVYGPVAVLKEINKKPTTDSEGGSSPTTTDGAYSASVQNWICRDQHFYELPKLLPSDALMVFNDTKVVPARMFFQRETGAHIEIFCLEPVSPPEYERNFASTGSCTWKCIIGNAKRLKNDVLSLCNPHADESHNENGEPQGQNTLHNPDEIRALNMTATLVERDGETASVRFGWSGNLPFSTVLELCGRIPIPPYLNRETEEIDKDRYQTLYAKYRGSVAAPTAGLHFTDRVLAGLRERGIETANVCLHVGAGTFLPVKDGMVAQHKMHSEPFSVTRSLLTALLEAKRAKRPITAVGTTSVRTIESLYYVGAKCIEKGIPSDVEQWEPYERCWNYTAEETLEAIISYMDGTKTEKLTLQDNAGTKNTHETGNTMHGKTSGDDDAQKTNSITLGTRIIIVPGFDFKFTDILVTNFHQPQSTLLLLISAFLGGEWRPLYDHALENGYRFLSYGDSSLLFRRPPL